MHTFSVVDSYCAFDYLIGKPRYRLLARNKRRCLGHIVALGATNASVPGGVVPVTDG